MNQRKLRPRFFLKLQLVPHPTGDNILEVKPHKGKQTKREGREAAIVSADTRNDSGKKERVGS
jgi:hypothetical protein